MDALLVLALFWLGWAVAVDMALNPCRYFGHRWRVSPLGKSHGMAWDKDGGIVGLEADVFECERSDKCCATKKGPYRTEPPCNE